MTLFQPLWPTRPGRDVRQRGWNELQVALQMAPTERERRYVATAQAFFAEPDDEDYWLRIRRWEQASAELHRALPDDDEAAAFYALAHLATTPANVISRANADESAAILLRVYEANPDHPGAMHYLVHANDVPGRERELLEITRKYETAAPRNPHALHMPTHIYTRLGDWDGVIRGNLLAADAALEHPAGEHGEFVWDEFPHAIEYLVYAYLQQGDGEKGRAQIDRLAATERLEPSFKTAFHVASTRARHALERQDWETAASLPIREPASLDWDLSPGPKRSRSMRAVSVRPASASRGMRARPASGLRRWRRTPHTRAKSSSRATFASCGSKSMRGPRSSRANRNIAIERMQEAATLETSTPKHAVTPAPTIPAHEQLGDLWMTQGQPARALEAYRRSLGLYPNRFGSLRGVSRAERALAQ